MLALLRNRDFVRLWLGQGISLVGDGIRQWALIYWVFKASGDSPLMLALSFIATTAPQLLMGPVAGVLVDRWERRRVMVWSDVVRGGCSLLLVVTVLSGEYLYALAVVFLAESAAQFFGPARGALLPRVVGQEHLVQANSLSQTTRSLLQISSPALGTVVFSLLGPMVAFALDALTFFLSALLIATIRVSGEPGAAQTSDFLGELKAGLQYVWQNQVIRVMMIALTVLFMGAGAINSLLVFLVKKSLGLPEEMVAYASTAMPVGWMLSAMAIGGLARRVRRPPLLVAAGLGVAGLAMAIIAVAPDLVWLVVGNLFIGLANALLNTGLPVTIQSLVPDNLRGRVFGALGTFPVAAMLISAGAAGVLAQGMDPRLIVGAAAVGAGVATAVAWLGLRGPQPAAAVQEQGTAG